MGPTSGVHHGCSLKKTQGQGFADKNGTRALTTVVAALNQGSWVGDQGIEKYCNGWGLLTKARTTGGGCNDSGHGRR